MPKLTLAQCVLLETAAAFALSGLVLRGSAAVALAVPAAGLLALGAVPTRGRWCYQSLRSRIGLLTRSRRGAAERILLDEIVEVPAGKRGEPIAAIRSGSRWAIPVELALSDLFNDEPAIDVRRLGELLHVEDDSIAGVRLLTLTQPSAAGADQLPSLTRCVCVLTIDAVRASAALAARGGTTTALNQVLHRCAQRAVEAINAMGFDARTFRESALGELRTSTLGAMDMPLSEQWDSLRAGATQMSTMLLAGEPNRVMAAVTATSADSDASLVVSCLAIERGPRGKLRAAAFTRVVAGITADMTRGVRADGVRRVPLGGEQVPALRATTLVPFLSGTA